MLRWGIVLLFGGLSALFLCIMLLTGFERSPRPRGLIIWFGLNLVAFFVAGTVDSLRDRRAAKKGASRRGRA